MYIKDFNPNDYNDDIWMSDLCISTNKILTYLPLINVKFIDCIISKYLFLYYDISQTSIKNFCYFKYLTEKEPNLIGSRILYQNSKQVLELKFNVPRYSFVTCNARKLYLFEFITQTELISMFTFWDGYVKFLPLKKAAARESSRLNFFIIVSLLASRSIYVQLLNFYTVRIRCGMGIIS